MQPWSCQAFWCRVLAFVSAIFSCEILVSRLGLVVYALDAQTPLRAFIEDMPAVIITGIEPGAINMASNSVVQFDWAVEASTDWDVLGPFPIHAREQSILSPAFPLDLSQPIDHTAQWPSAYADNGTVTWTSAKAELWGDLDVSFPHIRWKDIRATEGWAGIQHHALLHSTFTVYPSTSLANVASTDDNVSVKPPHLLVDLVRASYFAIRPLNDLSYPLRWHMGNIYGMERSMPHVLDIPELLSLEGPTVFEIFVSGDYEIRLFGDSHAYNPPSEIPKLSISLSIAVEPSIPAVEAVATHHVVCDFVDGAPFGAVLGIGVQAIAPAWAEVINAEAQGIEVVLKNKVLLAPGQTRIVPVHFVTHSYTGSEIQVDLTIVVYDAFPTADDEGSTQGIANSSARQETLSVILPLRQTTVSHWHAADYHALVATHISSGVPTAFLAVPPLYKGGGTPILALHGAGVDIVAQDFWATSLQRQERSWIVIPSGRTSWGLDWHGPSSEDAWSALVALSKILFTVTTARSTYSTNPDVASKAAWGFPIGSKVLLMGHSNGGQGAWYNAVRAPDRIIGVIPAAAYIKSQAYIPLTLSRSAHYIDPALSSILYASLTPDDNDLLLTNLVHTPVLAVHGGADENVPVWHSRELVGTLKTLGSTQASLIEDPGKGHWYPTVLNNERVQKFILDVLLKSSLSRDTMRSLSEDYVKEFTLTVASLIDGGSLHGWYISVLEVPGRIAKIHVLFSSTHEEGNEVVVAHVKTRNVHRFSVLAAKLPQSITKLVIDGKAIAIDPDVIRSPMSLHFSRNDSGEWGIVTGPRANVLPAQPPGRIQALLSTPSAIQLVIPSPESSAAHTVSLNIAQRISHDLDTYHKLDTVIAQGTFEGPDWEPRHDSGNVILIGLPSDPVIRELIQVKRTPFDISSSDDGLTQSWSWSLNGTPLTDPGQAIAFMHPHPTNMYGRFLLVLSGTDLEGLERASRFFPIRTGVPIPDWIIASRDIDNLSAAGITGAGFWSREWGWNEQMCWHNTI